MISLLPISLFLFFSLFPHVTDAKSPGVTDKTLEIYQQIKQIIEIPEPSKGTPYAPFISKPDPSHRIAIVGAGLAGLHMAHLLKKKGFNNIEVLEKESRTGGKVMSVKYDDVYHEMGAVYTSPDYLDTVYALATELGVDDFVSKPKATVWFDQISQPLFLRQFILMEVMRLTTATDPMDAIEKLVDASHKYIVKHREMFGSYKGELMLKPTKDVLLNLKKTFLSLLNEIGAQAIIPIVTAAHTMQGYGHLDTVSALYGVMWMTPDFLFTILERSLGLSKGKVDVFRNGFMQLTDKLAQLSNIHLNVNIKKIKRDATGVTITYNDGIEKTEKYDFLIWAADTREALKVLENPTPQENKFSNLNNTWFSTTLFDTTEQCKSYTPIDYWLSNLYGKVEHGIWARRLSKYVMNEGVCPTIPGVKTRISGIAYQMGSDSPLGTPIVQNIFNQHFVTRLGGENVTVVKAETWNYFPRYSVEDMADGVLWKIHENQGVHNTWFIGSSVILNQLKV